MSLNNVPGGFTKIGSNRYCKPIAGGIAYYSYSTLVLILMKHDKEHNWNLLDTPMIYKTSEFYSVTTSRHINQIIKDVTYGIRKYQVIPVEQAALERMIIE